MHRYTTQIHFDQCDPAGIIFYGRVFELTHRAFEGLVVEAGIDWSDWFASGSFVVPIIHAEVDFESPLRAWRHVEVEASVEKMGNTSIVFAYRVVSDSTVYATAKTVHVFMDPKTNKKIPIPSEIKDKLG